MLLFLLLPQIQASITHFDSDNSFQFTGAGYTSGIKMRYQKLNKDEHKNSDFYINKQCTCSINVTSPFSCFLYVALVIIVFNVPYCIFMLLISWKEGTHNLEIILKNRKIQ